MSFLLGTYDPAKYSVIVGGIIITGFADGEAIIARRNAEMFSIKAGIQGQIARARIADKSGEFEFKLADVSPTNDELSALFNLDNTILDGYIIMPVSIVDFGGRTAAFGQQCWIKKVPDLSLSNENTARTWTLTAAELNIYFGGTL